VKFFDGLERNLLIDMVVFDDQNVDLLSFAFGEIHQMIRNG